MNKYTAAPARAIPFEKFREDWQRQVVAEPKIPGCALKVALAIGWHMNRNSREAWPGVEKLAKLTNQSLRSVFRGIKWLEEHRHLSVKRKNGRVNHYHPTLAVRSHVASNDDAICQGTMTKRSGGHDRAVTQPLTELSQEPLIEPLREPLNRTATLRHRFDIDADSKKIEEKGSGEEERKVAPLHAKPNPTARCFGLAEKWWPKDRALVAKALKNYPAAEVLAELEFAIEEGCDIRDVLAGMVADYDAA